MPRLLLLGQAKMMDGLSQKVQIVEHPLAPVQKLAVVAPSSNNKIGPASSLIDVEVVVRPYRINVFVKAPRVCTAERKDVGYLQALKAPLGGIPPAPAHSRIIMDFIGGRRIQTDEEAHLPIID